MRTFEYIALSLALTPLATLAIVYLWRRPKHLALVALASVLVVRTVSHLTGVQLLDNLEDFFTVLLIVRAGVFVLQRQKAKVRLLPGVWLSTVFVALGLVSGVVQGIDAAVLLSATYLAAKGVLFGFAVAQLDWTTSDIRAISRVAAWVLFTVFLTGVASILAPSGWARIFSVSGSPISRYGLPSASGVFIHPFDFAFVCSFGAIGALTYCLLVEKNWRAYTLFVLLSIGTFTSLRRKDLIGLILASASTLLQARRWVSLAIALLLFPIIIYAAWDQISEQALLLSQAYFSPSSNEARTLLTVGAFSVASSYFPLGAGFGRYGSRTAATDYSDEYLRLGFASKYGLGPTADSGFFLTDTAWPAVIGEAGYVGSVAFLGVLVVSLRYLIRIRKSSKSPELRWLGAMGTGWMILLIVQSTAAAVFTSPPMYPWVFALVGLCISLEHENVDGSASMLQTATKQES